MPSPMRGRWHGEAVTDEVGQCVYATLSTSSVACGDSFPLIGDAMPAAAGFTSQALRVSAP